MGVSAAHAVSADPAGLAGVIGEHLLAVLDTDELEVVSVRPLGGGAVQDNLAVDVRVGHGPGARDEAFVLRPEGPGVATSLDRSTEFAVLRAAWELGLRVPEPVDLCTDEGVIGRPFFLMRRLGGVAAAHRIVRDETLDGEALVGELARELARLHAVRPPFPGLEDLIEPADSTARTRVAFYRRCLDQIPEPQPAIEWGLRWLERRGRPSPEVVLCHGDFRTGNFLVEDGRLVALLDWEFAGWGDRHEDIAWFCARCWRAGAYGREAGGLAAREVFYRAYEEASGVAVDPEAVRYWEVMAAVKWAVLALQQGRRHLSGERPSLELALTGRMVPEMELDILVQLEHA